MSIVLRAPTTRNASMESFITENNIKSNWMVLFLWKFVKPKNLMPPNLYA